MGVHTICVTGVVLTGRARWWRALWESGKHAALDGAVALVASGLKGWDPRHIDVTVPNNARTRTVEGVRHHRLRERAPVIAVGLWRTRPEVAAVRAAQWAVSDAEAATILAMTIQQRLTSTRALLQRWLAVGYSARRSVLDGVIKDICAGAQSLGSSTSPACAANATFRNRIARRCEQDRTGACTSTCSGRRRSPRRDPGRTPLPRARARRRCPASQRPRDPRNSADLVAGSRAGAPDPGARRSPHEPGRRSGGGGASTRGATPRRLTVRIRPTEFA